jgi:hypothetical protein
MSRYHPTGPASSLCPWLLAVIARNAYIAADIAVVAAPSL